MEGVVAAAGEFGVNVDEVADAGDFGGEDDLVAAEAVALGGGGVVEGGDDHGFHHDVAGFEGMGCAGVFVHHAGEEGLVEGAPVDADADGFLVVDGALDHGAEVVVVFATDADVAGVDAVFGEGAGAGGVFAEEDVAVVMEVADDGGVPALGVEGVDDVGDGFGGVVVVDGDADKLGAGAGEGGNLLDGGLDVGGVGVGHRLDDDGGFGADADASDVDGNGFAALERRHKDSLSPFPANVAGVWSAEYPPRGGIRVFWTENLSFLLLTSCGRLQNIAGKELACKIFKMNKLRAGATGKQEGKGDYPPLFFDL